MAKGIIFNEPTYYQVVRGDKTQLRKLIDGRNYPIVRDGCFIDEYRGGFAVKKKIEVNPERFEILQTFKPRYKPGETLYIKEPYVTDRAAIIEARKGHDVNWLPAITMPEKRARYFINITAVRCERLQDISDEDCLKSGIKKIASYYDNGVNALVLFQTPRQAFADLINERYGKGTWKTNPYVWVYEFKSEKKR
jgi:hypothetical protein